ncbi:MAG: HNH endonuclease, partial [Anaerolineales bacterium]
QHPRQPTLDHVIPRRLGGEHTWENLVTACSGCNHKKGGRTAEQANMKLLCQPHKPPASAQYIFGKYLSHHIDWVEFVEGW